MNDSSLIAAKSRYRNLPVAVMAAVAAAVVGMLATSSSSTVAAGAASALLAGALLARLPGATFGACLLALSYSPESLGPGASVFAHPQLQKGLIYFGALGIGLHRGMRPRFLIAPGAYVLLAVLSVLNGQLIAGLTLTQMLSSFVTLTVGWAALAIRWDFERDAVYLKILSCLPVACVVLGILMQAAHLHSLYATANGTSRLEGASGPAQLALTSFIACITASICYRTTRWKFAPLLVVADGIILALTVSRGAALALGIAMAWPVLRFAFASGEGEGIRWVRARWARIGFLVGAVAVVASLVVPSLLARDKGALTYVPGVGFIHDATSGRAEAWHEFYAIAARSPLFGHGLGSGPITKITQQGFLAQHNEFLRLFLEGGYIGGGLVLAAIIFVIGTCIARAPRWMRFDLLGLALGFAVLSYTDNTLTSVNLQVPFCLVFGLVATVSHRPAAATATVRAGPAVSLDQSLQAVG